MIPMRRWTPTSGTGLCGSSRRCAGHKVAGTADPTLLVIGSAEQYGAQEGPMPLREEADLRRAPSTPRRSARRRRSRSAAARADGVTVVATARSTTPGRGQGGELLPAPVARAAGSRGARRRPPGRSGTRRRCAISSHVEDVVSAYISLVERGRPGEAYNVCSGGRGSRWARRPPRSSPRGRGRRGGLRSCSPPHRRRSAGSSATTRSSAPTPDGPPPGRAPTHRRPPQCHAVTTSIASS
jgi:hypothetical protein